MKYEEQSNSTKGHWNSCYQRLGKENQELNRNGISIWEKENVSYIFYILFIHFLKFIFITCSFLSMFVCAHGMYVHVCSYMYVFALYKCNNQGGQKRSSEPLDHEFAAVMSSLMWMLGTKPGSSARAEADLSH